MSTLDLLSRSDILLVSAATIIIVFAIVITSVIQGTPEIPFSQVVTAGPVWPTDTWLCTSTADFIIHSTLISYGDRNTIQIYVSGQGTQPDFEFEPLKMQSFSIGGPGGSSIMIKKNAGTVTGFLTLQTTSNAIANCEAITR